MSLALSSKIALRTSYAIASSVLALFFFEIILKKKYIKPHFAENYQECRGKRRREEQLGLIGSEGTNLKDKRLLLGQGCVAPSTDRLWRSPAVLDNADLRRAHAGLAKCVEA